MDVASFLARHPPFAALDPGRLLALASHVEIEHFAPGDVILTEAGEPTAFLYVVRKGRVEIVDDGRVIDEVVDGQVFGLWSLLGHVAPTATVRAAEDTLCYLVEPERAKEALETPAGIAFVAASARRRIERVGEVVASDRDPQRYRHVGELVRRPPVRCEPTTSVADAAALMARERVSSLLVATTGGDGILTDRDLRARVVAERRGPETPVAEVMTPTAVTVPADAMAGEVLLRMLDGGFHHFPVTDAAGQVLGVITDTDLMGIGRETPFALKSAIARSDDPEDVATALRGLPDVVTVLVDSSADPVDVGHVVAFVIDAAVLRLIDLAEREIGPSPGRWSWFALGSAARHEQALRTDQDHAIVHEGDEDVEPYLARLAEVVTAGLERGGIPRCDANAMATNPLLRRTVEGWHERFHAWIDDVGPQGSENLSILFDYRRVTGSIDIEDELDEVVLRSRSATRFLRHLQRRALDLRPPTGFVRDFVVEAKGDHAGRLDLKHGGLTPIANLARAYALRAGRTEKRTIERLRAAYAEDVIDAETREGLEESFRFLWEIRLRHQVEQHRVGEPPDDFVDPRELGAVARQGLKEAFRIIGRAQRGLATELGVPMR